MSAHPVVLFLESVQTDGSRVHAGTDEAFQPFGSKEQSVCHHAPRESFFVNGSSAFFQIFAHQRFASGQDDEYLVRVGVCGYIVQHPQEIFFRHVLVAGYLFAIASAMAAMQVTAQRAFPEQLPQRMFLDKVVGKLPVDFQPQAFA